MKFLLFVILSLLLSACQPMSNSLGMIAFECGVSPETIQNLHYFKLRKSSGEDFGATETDNLEAAFESKDGSSSALNLTPNACVILPPEQGIVKVRDIINSEGLAFETEQNQDHRPKFNVINLVEQPQVEPTLNCPIDGLFADETLAANGLINFAGYMPGIELRLSALEQQGAFYKDLYTKKMGEARFDFNQAIDLRGWSEGIYDLKIYVRHLNEGLNKPLRIIQDTKECRLTILKGISQVGIENEVLDRKVYALGSILPWNTERISDRLFYCKEARSNRAPALNSACETSSSCADPAQFTEVKTILADQPGIFDYFVVSEDKLGRKSSTSCKTLVISDAAPEVAIQWDHDDLRQAGSVLRQPYAEIRARIQTKHPYLDANESERQLECKVDFEIQTRERLSGDRVTCTKGRCQGLAMGQFVPCDKDLQFSLVDAWDQPSISHSRLILTVRATDGAGKAQDATHSLWINQSAWQMETLSYQPVGKKMPVADFAVDSNGDVLAAFYTELPESASDNRLSLAAYRQGLWHDLKDQFASFHFKMVKNPTDSVYFLNQQIDLGGQLRTQIYRYVDRKLVPLIDQDAQSQITQKCNHFSVDALNRPWCMGSGRIQLVGERGISALPIPADMPPSDLDSVDNQVLVAENQDVIIKGSQAIHVWKENHWITYGLTDKNLTLLHLIQDYKKRLWVVAGEVLGGQDLQLLRIENGSFIPEKTPFPLPKLLANRDRTALGLRSFHLGMLQFDFQTDTWSYLSQWAQLQPPDANAASAILNGNRKVTSFGNKGVFVFGDDVVYWPLRVLGLTCPVDCRFRLELSRDEIYSIPDTLPGVPVEIRRIRKSPLTKVDGPLLGVQDSFVIGSWYNPKGQLEIAFYDQGIYTFDKEQIKKRRVTWIQNTIGVREVPSGRICLRALSGLHLMKVDGSLEKKLSESYGHGLCNETADDAIWWIDYEKSVIRIFDGKTIDTLKVDGKTVEGPFVDLMAVNDGRTIIALKSRGLSIFSNNRVLLKEISLENLPGAEEVQEFIRLMNFDSEKLLAVTRSTNGALRHYWLDLTKNHAQQDQQLDGLLQGKGILQAADGAIGTFAWTDQALLQFTPGHQTPWKKVLEKQELYRPDLDIEKRPIQFLPPLAEDRYMIYAMDPYQLWRFDR